MTTSQHITLYLVSAFLSLAGFFYIEVQYRRRLVAALQSQCAHLERQLGEVGRHHCEYAKIAESQIQLMRDRISRYEEDAKQALLCKTCNRPAIGTTGDGYSMLICPACNPYGVFRKRPSPDKPAEQL